MVATSAILRGDFETAAREFRSRRDNHLLTDYDWIFFIFNIKSPQGRDLHWTLGGCNVANRCIGYYDFGQVNRDSGVHLLAMQRFMELLVSTEANGDSRPWLCVPEGTASMERQNNSYDCGPSVCLMADALVSGVPLSVITCAAVANSRLYIAMCLRTGVSDDLARLVTAEIRPGRGRLVTIRT